MMNDLKNSIKAKMYEFTYTPFLSSVIISWLVLNHKYILIYFSDTKLKEKMKVLNNYDFSYNFSLFNTDIKIPFAYNIAFPILFGLFYVFIYPIISKIFYEYTLNNKKKLKKVKQKIEDETPITNKEAKELRRLHIKYEEEIDTLTNKVLNAEKAFKNFISPDEYQIIKNKNDELLLKNNGLSGENNKLKSDIKNIQDQLKQFTKEYNNQDDETKILKYFYDWNKKESYKDLLITEIVDKTKIARPIVKNIIEDLISNNVLNLKEYDKINITDYGYEFLIEKFSSKS